MDGSVTIATGGKTSHTVRLTFEQIGTWVVLVAIGVGLLACAVSFWPADWASVIADHVNKISATMLSFVGTLGGVLGLSWGRGHMDARIGKDT